MADKIFRKYLRDTLVELPLILDGSYENTGIVAPNKELEGSGGSGISDGNKGDITVSGGGDVFTINPSSIEASMLSQMGATNGQVLKWNGTTWVPVADNDTTYSAGQGLELTGTTFKLAQNGATLGQVIKWNGSQWLPANDLQSTSGIQLYQYSAGNGGYAVATNLGVTFTKSSGVGTFVIPEGIKLISARIHGISSDLNSNSFSVIFAGHYLNGNVDDLYPPTVVKYDRALEANPSEALPYVYDLDNTPQVQITGINPLKIRVINLNGIYNWGLKIQM